MLFMKRVIDEIQHVGLYDLVLQDIQRLTGKEQPTAKEIETALKQEPQLLRDYMQTTVEYNLSNIHLRDIDLEYLDASCKKRAQTINSNLAELREIEKYTLDFEQSATLVLIFSVEFFVLFSVQYFIVLMDLKAYQWYIYTFFGASILLAWWYARKQREKYAIYGKRYEELYDKTLGLLEALEYEGCIRKEDLYIESSDEHI